MSEKPFTKDNLDLYLKELAKEFRKRNGKSVPAEIILIGGASVLINYGFRETTYDMDAIINAASSMKDAINTVGDKYDLSTGWLNTDFINTSSYTSKIINFSRYYRTYSNVVTFRTVTGEYLIAMKLMAGRQYKYDRSDVIGILWEQEKSGEPFTLEEIKKAVTDLYGSYESLPEESRTFIENAFTDGNFEELYEKVRQLEKENKNYLVQFNEKYPDAANDDNVNDIIEALRKKQKQ